MLFYLAIMCVSLFFIFIANLHATVRSKNSIHNLVFKESKFSIKPNITHIFYFLAFLTLLLPAVFRAVGSDMSMYRMLFQNASSYSYSLQTANENGFVLINYIINQFTSNFQVMVAFYSIVTIFLMFFGILKYSNHVIAAVFVYIVSTQYTFAYGGIRQMAAIAIVFASYSFLRDRKIFPYFLLVLLASSIHMSALVMLPIYGVVNRPLKIKYIIIIMGLLVFFMIFSKHFLSLIIRFFPRFERYEKLGFFGEADDGILPLIPTSIFFIITLFFQKQLIKKDIKNIQLINMSFYSFLFSVMGIFIWSFSRFRFWTECYYILLFPQIPTLFASKKQRIAMGVILVIMGLIYFAVMAMINHGGAFPYKSI